MTKTHCMSGTSTYQSWTSMHRRCNDEARPNYKFYGGRGIKVCDRWETFENFLGDMGVRPKGMTLDRYPNKDGDYEPGNCRWATHKEQCANRRPKTGHKSTCINGHLLPPVGAKRRRCAVCHNQDEVRRRAKRKAKVIQNQVLPGVSLPAVGLEIQKCMGFAR